MSRVRLVLFRISVRNWISFNGRACHGFRSAKWPGPTQSSPARSGPAQSGPRAPGAPPPLPMRPPPLPLSFGFPAQQPPSPSPTSLSPWCPRDWRRRSPEFGPRGELPSPPFSSLSLSPSPSSSLPVRAPPLLSPARARVPARRRAPAPPRRGGPPLPSPSRRAPVLAPCAAARPSPSPAAARPRRSVRPPARRPGPSARSPVPGAALSLVRSPLRAAFGPYARRPSPGATRVASFTPLTRSHVRKPTHAVIIFGFVVNFKLRKLVCCVARFVTRRICLISDPINVLCRALRRVTIHFNFRLFNV
jgi:hypothetical protein